jgi:hypothetical protein
VAQRRRPRIPGPPEFAINFIEYVDAILWKFPFRGYEEAEQLLMRTKTASIKIFGLDQIALSSFLSEMIGN